ncbi:hypothetical protein N431DRAFT_459272 [Stipitochalara longipes BDJ]|nr:hypothetical protein N431DRAFT_459272 [Stipitochalara longipes BDJ]
MQWESESLGGEGEVKGGGRTLMRTSEGRKIWTVGFGSEWGGLQAQQIHRQANGANLGSPLQRRGTARTARTAPLRTAPLTALTALTAAPTPSCSCSCSAAVPTVGKLGTALGTRDALRGRGPYEGAAVAGSAGLLESGKLLLLGLWLLGSCWEAGV